MASKLVQQLLDLNKERSLEFKRAQPERQQYRTEHPTEIAATKCMDGRLLLPRITKTPLGIIQPYRNLGGVFDLGWPFFQSLIHDWVKYATHCEPVRNCLVLNTYHFSKGDMHRGCKGYNNDTLAAIEDAMRLKRQFERVFGQSVVYSVVVGIETDEDALHIHGEDGEVLDLSRETETTPNELLLKLQDRVPKMRERMLRDFFELACGNVQHIIEIRKQTDRKIEDVEHKEQVIGVGRGFPWLHWQNKALLIGPYSYNIDTPIARAGGIAYENLIQKRIPLSEGVVLMGSAVYRDSGTEELLAIEKAKSLTYHALEVLKREVPELMEHLHVIAGTVDLRSIRFEPVPLDLPAEFVRKAA